MSSPDPLMTMSNKIVIGNTEQVSGVSNRICSLILQMTFSKTLGSFTLMVATFIDKTVPGLVYVQSCLGIHNRQLFEASDTGGTISLPLIFAFKRLKHEATG